MFIIKAIYFWRLVRELEVGIDFTALRCTLWKTARESWSIASTDIRGIFLFAPRSQYRCVFLLIELPWLLTLTALIPMDSMDERWVCDGALYNLGISPVDWAIYRDYRMSIFRREIKILDLKEFFWTKGVFVFDTGFCFVDPCACFVNLAS